MLNSRNLAWRRLRRWMGAFSRRVSSIKIIKMIKMDEPGEQGCPAGFLIEISDKKIDLSRW